MIAVLFAADKGPYTNDTRFDAWTKARDARKYIGPWPVIAHSPCERYGRYWGGGPSVKVKKKLGDDEACFIAAIRAVQLYRGVLEHPADTYAFDIHRIPHPNPGHGWECVGELATGYEWVCHVEQGHYGHPARKATWLYVVSWTKPQELIWGPSKGIRLDEGFHSQRERVAARTAGKKPVKRLSKAECEQTPKQFVEVLAAIAAKAALACDVSKPGDKP